MAGSTQVKLKRYCYALRSALALAWIGSNQTVPPMNIRQLLEGLSLSEQFKGEIDRMIDIKSGTTEKYVADRNNTFDQFIEATLAVKTQRPVVAVSSEFAEEADRLFRQIVLS